MAGYKITGFFYIMNINDEVNMENVKHTYDCNGDTATLTFDLPEYHFECKLYLKDLYGSVKMRTGKKEYDLSIYRHMDDMVFCVMDTASKDETYVKHASFWHSYGNLFDRDSFTLKKKVEETIDVISNLCKDQLKLFKRL